MSTFHKKFKHINRLLINYLQRFFPLHLHYMDLVGKVNTRIDLLIIYLQLFLCILDSELKFTDYIQAIF